jgi:SMODS-associated and fused to various effectors sensor domain
VDAIEIDASRPDVAVALGLTHDVSADVRRYVDAKLPSVGRLLVLKPSSGPGSQSVVCGRHAFELADAATDAIRGAHSEGLTHLFIAAPNSFNFFLGQRRTILGPVRLYEFDFGGGRDRSYMPALTLPLPSDTDAGRKGDEA